MLTPNFSPFPILSAERVFLRPLEIRDADEIFILRSDDRVNEFTDREKAITVTDALQFIERIRNGVRNNHCIYWAISLTPKGALIGTVGLWNFSSTNGQAELGYEILPEFQGQGYMHEAVENVLEYGFSTLKLNVIVAVPHKENERSIHLLTKCGFSQDTEHEFNQDEDADVLVVYYRRKNNFTSPPGTFLSDSSG